MRYWYLRLFLTRRKLPPLLEVIHDQETVTPRRDYLRQVFSSSFEFRHYGAQFFYRPFQVIEGRYIAGVIARQSTEVVGLPPEDGFQPREIPDWQTANLFLDIDGSEDGQKIAMQNVIGAPLAVLRSFADAVNNRTPEPPWEIAVNTITAESEFWSVVETFKGNISNVEITFSPPNIWGGQSETEKALRELSGEDNATEVEVKIKNKEKRLNPKSKRLREAVDYVSRGGGELKLKSGQDTLYDSEEQGLSLAVEEDVAVQSAEESAITRVLRRLFG